MTLKRIDSEFLEPVLDIQTKSMEVAPFDEVSRRLGFSGKTLMEKAAYKVFIEFSGETDVEASTLAIRWNNVLTEIAAMRINGNLVVPAVISVQVVDANGVKREEGADVYIADEEDGTPYMVITTPKTRADYLNGTVQ